MQTPATNNINLFPLFSSFNFSSSYEKERKDMQPRQLQILIRVYIKQEGVSSPQFILPLTLGIIWASRNPDMFQKSVKNGDCGEQNREPSF